MTRVFTVHPEAPDPHLIAQAAEIILRRGLVAFPTETVYGLGANALDEEAVAKIFAAKGRPSNDPLIVHIASVEDVERVASEIPPIVNQLADAFWPGPLTLILSKKPRVPDLVTAGLNTVAVRVPFHPIALALIQASGVPIAAPSANRFGHTSPTTAAHVMDDLANRIDLILDGGPATIGVESTVLDVTRQPYIILRPGGVSREALENLIGPVAIRSAGTSASSDTENTAQLSPGLLSKHYTPRAELILCQGSAVEILKKLVHLAQIHNAHGRRVGLLLANEDMQYFKDTPCLQYPLGLSNDLTQIARVLYAGMRTLDEKGADVILTRDFGERGLGLAIHDRLLRAASEII